MARGLNLQIVMAALVVVLGVWAVAQRSSLVALVSLGTGVAIGTWSGRNTGRKLAAQFARRRRIVLYSEDTPLYAALLPLASLTFSPGVLLSVVYSAWVHPPLQLLLPAIFCFVTTAWLAHEVTVSRLLTRLAEGGAPVSVQWFHARSVLGPEGMIGQRAVVLSDCHPDGYVRLHGERWRARSLDGTRLGAGEPVVIEYLDGLILVVSGTTAEDCARGAG